MTDQPTPPAVHPDVAAPLTLGSIMPGRPSLRPFSLRRLYGAGPVHLVALLAAFAFTGYICSQIAQVNAARHVGIWFIGSVLGHDLILWPIYTTADRLLVEAFHRHQSSRRPPLVAWINFVRAPVVLAAVLLVVSFPLVFNWSPQVYRADTGLSTAPFANRWLAVVGALFLASAICYAMRLAWVIWRRRPVSTSVPRS